jgi:hypothetical protein
MKRDVKQWLEQQYKEFMTPESRYFTKDEAREYCKNWDSFGVCDDDESPGAGYYARLSASGYLDCTDWMGPFETEDEALESLYDTYAD